MTYSSPLETALTAIVTNPDWLAALDRWNQSGSRHSGLSGSSLGLQASSWRELQYQLLNTGWFKTDDINIECTTEGREMLARASELMRAAARESTHRNAPVLAILGSLPLGPAAELGCGAGHDLRHLSNLGYSPLYGYDKSPVALALAKAEVGCANPPYFYCGDATELPEIHAAELALLYSRNALQYFDSKRLARTIQRVLRPGGYVVAEMISWRYYLRFLKDCFRPALWWRVLSYARTLFRTGLYTLVGWQPRLAARAPEIGWTSGTIRRFARSAGLDLVSLTHASSPKGHLVVFRKPLQSAP